LLVAAPPTSILAAEWPETHARVGGCAGFGIWGIREKNGQITRIFGVGLGGLMGWWAGVAPQEELDLH